jgi:hypothetical protein
MVSAEVRRKLDDVHEHEAAAVVLRLVTRDRRCMVRCLTDRRDLQDRVRTICATRP